ncbi:hypothetical protein BC628DRAFT_701809 [Trametes gibbosa]|nr:hypothetical protein BC628DRAFT_701809 [Trametes gibbosa]
MAIPASGGAAVATASLTGRVRCSPRERAATGTEHAARAMSGTTKERERSHLHGAAVPLRRSGVTTAVSSETDDVAGHQLPRAPSAAPLPTARRSTADGSETHGALDGGVGATGELAWGAPAEMGIGGGPYVGGQCVRAAV